MHVRLAAVTAACFAACTLALAADAEGVVGTIVKVDKAKKTLTVKTEDGQKSYSASKETKFFGPRGGASEEGIEDERLTPGAQVRISTTGNGRWLKEVHVMSAASTKRETATNSDKMMAQKPKASDAGEKADDLVRGTIVTLDKTKKTLTVKTDEGTKTFAVTRGTKFIGPRNAVSEDGIDDARLTTGAEISIVPTRNGRSAREIHMTAAARSKPASPTADTGAKSDKSAGAAAIKHETAAKSDKMTAQKPKSADAGEKTDNLIRGTVIEMNKDSKTLSVKTGEGERTFAVTRATKFIGADNSPVQKGINDSRLSAGSLVGIVPTRNGRSAREIHMMAAAPSSPERPVEDSSAKSGAAATMPGAARTTRAPAQAPVHHTAAKPVDGVEARIISVDQAAKHITVQLKTGRKQDLTVTDETEFIGPRGGVSDRGIKDDRVTPGADVTLVFMQSGRVLKEVHLPYRNEIERNEKDK
jgi:hypothetical protein